MFAFDGFAKWMRALNFEPAFIPLVQESIPTSARHFQVDNHV